MPKAFEVKAGVHTAAERQLWSVAIPYDRQFQHCTAAELAARYQFSKYTVPERSGSKAGLFSVTWSGKGAFATWNVDKDGGVKGSINYPYIDDRSILTRAEADLFSGYTLHELGHILYTDNSAVNAKGMSGKLFKIWNGLEDPRIEACMINAGTGGARNSFEQLLSKMLIEAKGTWNPCDLGNLPFTLAVLGRIRLYGLDVPMLRNIYGRMPANVAAFYTAVMDKLALAPLDRVAGTAATLALAKEIFSMVKDASAPPPPPPEGGGSAEPDESEEPDGDDGESGDGDAGDDDELEDFSDEDGFYENQSAPSEKPESGAGESDDSDDESEDDSDCSAVGDCGDESDEESDESGESDESSSGDKPEDGEGADDAEGEGGDSEDTGAAEKPFTGGEGFGSSGIPEDLKGSEFNIEDLCKKIRNRTNKQLGEKALNGVIPGTTTDVAPSAEIEDWLCSERVYDANGRFKEFKRFDRPIPAVKDAAIRQAILRMLDAPESSGWDNGRSSGRFDRRAVSKMFSGSENVFARRWEQEGIDTAGYLLIDCSGSMQNNAPVCESLARSIGSIMERARVPFAITGFTTGGGQDLKYKTRSEGDIQGFKVEKVSARFSDGAAMIRFKAFGDRMSARESDISRIRFAALGGTPDLSAVAGAINELLVRPERRKVLFVLTDGIGDGAETAKRVADAESMGVDVVGIGIGCNVSGIYPISATVWDLADLSAATFKGILTALSKRAVKAA